MFYLIQVYALLGGAVFFAASLILLTLLAWFEIKDYLAARQRIQNRLASFVKPLANSRNISRSHGRASFTPHEIQ